MESPWDEETKVCSNGHGHMTKMAAVPICIVKTLKNLLWNQTKRPMTLRLDVQHQVLEYYQICLNDDPGLTFTYLTVRSNLVLYACVWETEKKNGFLRNYCHL